MTYPRGLRVHALAPRDEDSTSTATSPIWPPSTDRLCRVRTTFSSRPTGLTPRRLGTHPLHVILEYFYFFQYFSHLSPLPSRHSLGRVTRRLEWIETAVQSVGLIVELTIDDPRLPACVDADAGVSGIDTTRHILGVPVTMSGKEFACWQ